MNTMRPGRLVACLMAQAGGAAGRSPARQDQPILESELIVPLEHWHNHGSWIVESLVSRPVAKVKGDDRV